MKFLLAPLFAQISSLEIIMIIGTISLAWPALMTVFFKTIYDFATFDVLYDELYLSKIVETTVGSDTSEPKSDYFSDAGFGSRLLIHNLGS